MTMIERVARELRECGKRNKAKVFGDDDTGWRAYVEDARAILVVMKTPSVAMQDALFEIDARNTDTQIRTIYTRMIDAALGEQV